MGNPPWVRPRTDVEALLAEGDPWWQLVAKATQAQKAERRSVTLSIPGLLELVVDATGDVVVMADFIGSPALFPHLSGLQPDLYRSFIEQTWSHQSQRGVVTLIHPESHFTDEKAGQLRRAAYSRLRRHWQFKNALFLFEVHDQLSFGVHVYASAREPEFLMATSLYHPDTVIRSFAHDGSGDEPGLKEVDGGWDMRPHLARIARVTSETLGTWHALLESPTTPVVETRMVYAVNRAAVDVLDLLSGVQRLGTLPLEFSRGWDESIDRVKGYFDSEWGRPDSWREVILQGPALFVCTPFYKQPNSTMLHNQDWSSIDLETLPADAVPVTSYKPRGSKARYDADYSHWRGADSIPARDHYRVAWRAMAANANERTLIPAAIPPGAGHINGVFSVGLPSKDPSVLAVVLAAASSLTNDFLIRSVPKSGIYQGSFERLALPDLSHPLMGALIHRTMRLNCLTNAFSDWWNSAVLELDPDDVWTGGLAYPGRRPLAEVGRDWAPSTPLRRASDRRQAQVEADAIVALSLGLNADALCTIYRTQFAVLYGYDRNTYFYDANGRLVPNSVLTVWRKKGNAFSEEERTATNPSGNTYLYELPFVTLDREADMRRAYAHFEKVLAEKSRTDSGEQS